MQEPRSPVVAGSFYPASKRVLEETVQDCFLNQLGPRKLPFSAPGREERSIIGLVTPHAGYRYSGYVAAHGYYQLSREKIPETLVIIGPNHTGLGQPVSVYKEGEWITPLGEVRVNRSLANRLIASSNIISADKVAHMQEHSIEVQLPFLQVLFNGDFEFVPICMMDQSFEASCELGKAISLSSQNDRPLIIASTDFTHYESRDIAARKDSRALDAILELDATALLKTVDLMNISMCGAGPVAAMLVAARSLGAEQAELLAYQTSGDITGDYTSVVGYASIEVSI